MLAKHQQLNNVLVAYFFKISIRLAACKLGIVYCMAAGGCNLHPAGGRLNETCTRMAAN